VSAMEVIGVACLTLVAGIWIGAAVERIYINARYRLTRKWWLGQLG